MLKLRSLIFISIIGFLPQKALSEVLDCGVSGVFRVQDSFWGFSKSLQVLAPDQTWADGCSIFHEYDRIEFSDDVFICHKVEPQIETYRIVQRLTEGSLGGSWVDIEKGDECEFVIVISKNGTFQRSDRINDCVYMGGERVNQMQKLEDGRWQDILLPIPGAQTSRYNTSAGSPSPQPYTYIHNALTEYNPLPSYLGFELGVELRVGSERETILNLSTRTLYTAQYDVFAVDSHKSRSTRTSYQTDCDLIP